MKAITVRRVGLALVGLFALAATGYVYLSLKSIERGRQNFANEYLSSDIPKRISIYMEDGAALEHLDWPAKLGLAGKDAGPFLNPLMGWTEFSKDTSGALSLPKELVEERFKQRNQMEWRPDWKKWKLDFEWMKRLHEFTYWDTRIDQRSPKPWPILEVYINPDYSTLQNWAILRLLQSRDEGKPLEGIRDARQLAILLGSQEGPTAGMIAVGIFSIISKFSDFEKLADGKLDKKLLGQAKYFFYSPENLADPRIPDDLWNKAVSLRANRCGVASSVAKSTLMIRHIPAFASHVQRVQRFLDETESACGSNSVRRLWKEKGFVASFSRQLEFSEFALERKKAAGKAEQFDETMVNVMRQNSWQFRVPFLSAIAEEGAALIALSISNGFSLYREDSLKKREEQLLK